MPDHQPNASPLLLAVQGISKAYGYRTVLSEVRFELRTGECVHVQGANGSGKTTLLRILAGLTPSDAGTLLVSGMEMTPAELVRTGAVGYLGHDPYLDGRLTVREHLEFAAVCFDMVSPAVRIDKLLERADLAAMQRTRTRDLSRGWHQRLALCRAWLPDPRIVLLDEPDSHLDAEGLDFLASLLGERRAGAQGILFAGHRPPSGWADRVLILKGARLAEGAG
ncbi:MAG: heme ABC exporter ATP-binding protein CcmA [Caldilineaceae bacterium SB0662_bin_9]|uniref:Heme ABC exporter ATP-binding protein CcmA n=1 Tax=Caldilineaceae bacterium SB0662_bin_9 TaxID=2605258 RepID=A0A6B1DUE2_9CHLR|nr:heme ABC exporter ATP-binding protein CcmA [Caldilineaceae bacterium SB0662_bin_9]